MGPITAQWLDELGYDPDVPELNTLSASLPCGTVARARDGQELVAVARLASGRLVVVEDRCPHDGGRISDGYVEGEHLVCARHGWELEVWGRGCARRAACKPRE